MSRCRFEGQRPAIVRNLLKVCRKAEPEDISAGVDWYPKAQAIVREWTSHYRYSVDTVACVTAALSPQLEWTRNLIIADDVLAGRYPSIGGVLHSNLRKAEQLRDTDWKTDRLTIGPRMLEVFPGGPKVNSFAYNLAGDMNIVTVDTHAVQAALNDPLITLGIPWTPYRIFGECYAVAARKVDRQPAEFQAIVWYIWKRLYSRVWKIQNRTQWFAVSTVDDDTED
jgi:hypothetical protein